MSLRLPSQNKAFKPTRPFRRPGVPAAAPKVASTPGPSERRPSQGAPPTPGLSQDVTQSIQIPTQSTVIATPHTRPSQSQDATVSPAAPIAPPLPTSSQPPPSQDTLSETDFSKSAPPINATPIVSPPRPTTSAQTSINTPPSPPLQTDQSIAISSRPLSPPPPPPPVTSRATVTPRIPPSPRRARQSSLALSTTSTSISRSGRSALLQAAEAQVASGFSKPSPGRIAHRSRSASVRAPSVALSEINGNEASTVNAEAGPSSQPVIAAAPPKSVRADSRLPPPRDIMTQDPPATPSGLPPSLATNDSGLPPTLGTDAPSPSARSTSNRPSEPPEGSQTPNLTPAELAARAVAGILRHRGSTKPAARRKGIRDKEGHGIKTSKRTFREKHVPTIKPKAGTKKRKREGDEVDADGRRRRRSKNKSSDSDDTDSEDSDDEIVVRRGKYSTAGVAGTDQDRRKTQYRKKAEDQPSFSQASLDGLEPGAVIGDPINVNALTMADLATDGTHGKVSQRGLELFAFTKTVETQRKRERFSRQQNDWRRKQIQRRYLRDQRNKEKEAQRDVYRSQGQDPDVHVEQDEPHSEEEYEIFPDRLTPPDEPERFKRIQPISLTAAQPNGGGEQEPQEVQEGEGGDAEQWNENMRNTGTAQYNLDDLEDPEEIGETNAEGEVAEDDDEMTAQLLAAGYTFADDDRPASREEGEDSDGEPIDWSQYQNNNAFDSVQDYRDNIATRRAENMEMSRNQQVEEVDDTTKMVNSVTYRRYYQNPAPMKWDKEDTDMFYEVLRQTGENISLMTAFFPGRNHRNLKNKYMHEKDKDEARVNQALLSRKPLDTEFLAKATGYDPQKNRVVEAFLETTRLEAERIKSGLDPDAAAEEEAVMQEEGEQPEQQEEIDGDGFSGAALFLPGGENEEDEDGGMVAEQYGEESQGTVEEQEEGDEGAE